MLVGRYAVRPGCEPVAKLVAQLHQVARLVTVGSGGGFDFDACEPSAAERVHESDLVPSAHATKEITAAPGLRDGELASDLRCLNLSIVRPSSFPTRNTAAESGRTTVAVIDWPTRYRVGSFQ